MAWLRVRTLKCETTKQLVITPRNGLDILCQGMSSLARSFSAVDLALPRIYLQDVDFAASDYPTSSMLLRALGAVHILPRFGWMG